MAWTNFYMFCENYDMAPLRKITSLLLFTLAVVSQEDQDTRCALVTELVEEGMVRQSPIVRTGLAWYQDGAAI